MFRYKLLDERLLSLRFGGNNPHLIPRYGLIDHGPFKKLEYPVLSIRLVYPEELSDLIIRFSNILEEGGRRFPGFRAVYRVKIDFLDDISIKRDELINPLKNKSLRQAIEDDRKFPIKPIYIVVVPPYHKWYGHTPYNILKAELLKHNILSQMIRIDTLTTKPLEEVIFNVANALFAKAGGEPWRLYSRITTFSGFSDTVTLIGSGITRIPREPGYVEYDRYAGFVVLYSDEGRLLYINTFVTEYDRISALNKLKATLITAVDRCNIYDNIDVIIHYSGKDLNFTEEEELVKTITKLELSRRMKIHYVVLRVIRKPLYKLLFKPTRGYPPVGTYVQIGKRMFLTYTVGYLRNMSPIGVPTPLLLSIRLSDLNIDYIDVESLISSVCELARLNWRGVNVFNKEPVTVKYSRLLAYLAAGLKESGKLNPEDLPKDKPWFL